MKIHRFITEYEVIGENIIITESELIHQWKNVLKFKTNEYIILSKPTKEEVFCTLEELDKKHATLKVIESYENKKEPERTVALYMAVLKGENFEFVVQKATEVGISKIVPLVTEHTIKTGIKHDRLLKIAKEVAELCGRSTIPEISEPMNFEGGLEDAKKHYQKNILFDTSGEKLKSLTEDSLAIFIGPEGGFTEEEIAQAKKENFDIASLSELTFRGETAGIIASYLTVNL